MSKHTTSAKAINSPVTPPHFVKRFAYIVYNSLKKYIFSEQNKPVIYTALIFGLLGDLFFISGDSDLRFFVLIGLFFITSLFYRLASKFTFMLCLGLLVIMYVSFLSSDASAFTEKTSVWIVLFVTVGIIQQWNE